MTRRFPPSTSSRGPKAPRYRVSDPAPGPAETPRRTGAAERAVRRGSPTRVIVDIAVRAVGLVVLAEGAIAVDSALTPTDDALATGLTLLFVLVCGGAMWGLWDGLRRTWLRVCITWVAAGALVSVGVVRSLDAWSDIALVAVLVAVPALAFGLLASVLSQRSPGVGTYRPPRQDV